MNDISLGEQSITNAAALNNVKIQIGRRVHEAESLLVYISLRRKGMTRC